MAATRIFNASEFIRLALESAIERVEKRYGLGPAEDNGTGANGEDVVES